MSDIASKFPYSSELKLCQQCLQMTWHIGYDCLKCYPHLPPKDCICKHAWAEHHHGCIMNPLFPSENHARGACQGLMAEECEATQCNGDWLVDKEEDRCYCDLYEPFDRKRPHKRNKQGKVAW